MQVANTILEQLGGAGLLSVMLGACDFLCDENSLSFRWKAKSPWKQLKITLRPDDTYTLEFFKVRGTKVTRREPIEMVYAEDLTRICESETCLSWRNPFRGR